MEEIPSPRELRGAARACTILAYAAGLAGITAGTLVFRQGDLAFAIILWVMTFAVGTALMGVAVLVRAVAGLTARLDRLQSDIGVLVGDRGRVEPPTPERDPWLRHPPYG